MKKPKIIDIKISQQDQAQLDHELKRGLKKNSTIRKYTGGICFVCQGIPVKKVLHDAGDGFKRVEYYCNPCFERWVEKVTI